MKTLKIFPKLARGGIPESKMKLQKHLKEIESEKYSAYWDERIKQWLEQFVGKTEKRPKSDALLSNDTTVLFGRKIGKVIYDEEVKE